MPVLQDILEWSEERPIWQRDALRRIVLQTELSEGDIDQLALLCLEQHGIVDPERRAPDPLPLSEEHLPAGAGTRKRVQLIGIREVEGVNLLAQDQRMGFAPDGLTIVFGYNGSGKSGYARIIKSVCHARHRGDQILPNVFGNGRPPRPSATIDYRVGGANDHIRWEEGAEMPRALRQVSFFDADCAAVHVDAANQLAFTPFGLDVLPRLVRACQRLSEKIGELIEEQERVRPASLREPRAEQGTEVRRIIDHITKDTDIETFSALSEVSEGEVTRLKEIQEALGADPAARARDIRNAIARLRSLREVTNTGAETLSTGAIEEVRLKHSDWVTKSAAAAKAAEEAFGGQPLSGVGEEVWQELWNAARRYSVKDGYPDHEYPYVGDDAVCVLCQQPLADDAKRRLTTFERFVRDETQRAADEARQELDRIAASLQRLEVGRSAIAGFLADIDDEHAELRRDLRCFHGVAWKFRKRIVASCASSEWSAPSDLPVSPVVAVDELIQALSRRAQELDDATSEQARTALIRERNELLARQWLCTVHDDIRTEIDRKTRLAGLQDAARSTVTTGITRKSTELTEQYVTATVMERFSQELREIGATNLQIEFMSQGGQAGAVRFRIGLRDATAQVPVRKVLSEGESRCIAIAAFFAELSTEQTGSSLVFDDPVSSLDHQWRRRVADRLAREARNRQVIVFTHEIGFLHDLIDSSDAHDVEDHHSYLQRGVEYAGECLDGVPWPAMKIRDRIGIIKDRQQRAAAIHRRNGHAAYEPEARRTYGLLRETWERSIEELLINGAVVRFRRSIQTQQLRHLADITNDDLRAIEQGMTKCSRFLEGHDEPGAVMDPVPDPHELMADIESLEEWVNQMRPRRR